METNKLKSTTFCRRQITSDQRLHLFTYSTIFIWGWGWECNENLCQLKRSHDSLPHDTRAEFIIHAKPGFLMSRKSQTIGDFTVSRPSQILPLMKTRNLRYSRSSGMDRDKSGESGAFYFPDTSQISAMVVDHSQQMKTQICTVGNVCDGFRSLPIP